eukprot:12583784-Alexandrium_andersonii.AAC.1
MDALAGEPANSQGLTRAAMEGRSDEYSCGHRGEDHGALGPHSWVCVDGSGDVGKRGQGALRL